MKSYFHLVTQNVCIICEERALVYIVSRGILLEEEPFKHFCMNHLALGYTVPGCSVPTYMNHFRKVQDAWIYP